MQWRLGDIWSVATFNLFITTQSKGLFACLLLSTTPHPASGSFWCLAFFRKSVPIWHESLMMMMQKLFSPGPLCLSFFRKIRSHWSWISDDAAKTIFNLTMKENYRLYTLPYTLPLAQTSMVGVIKTFLGYIGMDNRCPNVLFLKVMSCYMTLSLTVERYISVVHPLLRWESLSLLSSNNSPSSRMTRRSPNSPKSFVYLAAPRSDSFSSPSLWDRDRLSVKELSPASLSRSCSPCPPTSCCRPRLLHR